mmetsp:Transcript_39889/g.111975  ORF Transcript_39889/g.111975 Transcript_39889/m.111975 type:complete len:211 (-) Transcript_39889:2-634(-)
MAAVLLGNPVLVPISPVHLPLFGIREALHHLGQLLEGLLGARSAVLVGVELQGELLVGPLDGVLAGAPVDLQDLVVVLRPQDSLNEARLVGRVGTVLPRANGASCTGSPRALPHPLGCGCAVGVASAAAGCAGAGGATRLDLGDQAVDGGIARAHPLCLLQDPHRLLGVASGQRAARDLLAPLRLVPVRDVRHGTTEGARGREGCRAETA